MKNYKLKFSKKHKLPLLILVLLFASINVYSLTLWENTELGMTPENVLKKVPNAEKVKEGNILKNDARELIRIKNKKIADKNFKASFYFLKNKLYQVTLQRNKICSYEDNLNLFKKIEKRLDKRYENRLEYNVDSSKMNKRAKAIWKEGNLKIIVLLLPITKDKSILNIIYKEFK